MVEGLVFGGIKIICEISNLLNSPERIPITSPEFWRQFSKRLNDDNKKET